MGVAAAVGSVVTAAGIGIYRLFSSNTDVETSKEQRDVMVSKINTSIIPKQSKVASKQNVKKLAHKKFSIKNINIAVIGHSGQGKSSFINAYFQKTKQDKNYAKVGITETTVAAQPFEYKVGGNKVVFWDLPGCGTNKFPFNKYIKTFGLPHFDICIIISANRYKEDDDKLAFDLSKFAKMPIYIIRSKFDEDLNNLAHDKCHKTLYEDLPENTKLKINEIAIKALKENLKKKFKKSYNIIINRFFILSSRYVCYTGVDWINFNKKITIDLLNCREQNNKLKLEAEKRSKEFDRKMKQRIEKEKKKFSERKSAKSQLLINEHNKKEFEIWYVNADSSKKYLHIFEENEYNEMDLLEDMDEDDLKEMGIKKLHRKKFLKAIAIFVEEKEQFSNWLKENDLHTYGIFLEKKQILTLSSFNRLLVKIKDYPFVIIHQTIPTEGIPTNILKKIYQKLKIETDFDFDQSNTPGNRKEGEEIKNRN